MQMDDTTVASVGDRMTDPPRPFDDEPDADCTVQPRVVCNRSDIDERQPW